MRERHEAGVAATRLPPTNDGVTVHVHVPVKSWSSLPLSPRVERTFPAFVRLHHGPHMTNVGLAVFVFLSFLGPVPLLHWLDLPRRSSTRELK